MTPDRTNPSKGESAGVLVAPGPHALHGAGMVEQQRVTLGSPESPAELEPAQILSLSDALDQLKQEDPTAAEVTRLRYFCGLTVREIAQATDVSERSVAREWAFARARLLQILGDGADL